MKNLLEKLKSKGFRLFAISFLSFFLIFEAIDNVSVYQLNNIIPNYSVDAQGRLNYAIGPDGHYYVKVKISDKFVPFLIDTGASNSVLCYADAIKIFHGAKNLLKEKSKIEYFQTANGIIATIPIVIEEFQLGDIVLKDVQVNVSMSNLQRSLLGMNVLSMLSVSMENNTMVIGRK